MKGNSRHDNITRKTLASNPAVKNARPTVSIDYEKYAHFLDDTYLTEDQRREYLDTIWKIICEFVSLGFGVHPLQQAQDACGQIEQNSENPPLLRLDDVVLETDTLNKKFNYASGLETDTEAERVKT